MKGQVPVAPAVGLPGAGETLRAADREGVPGQIKVLGQFLDL